MNGHDELIAKRVSGIKPDWIFINDYSCKTDTDDYEFPVICVQGDNAKTIDLRFVIGTKVNISSTSKARAKSLLINAINSGALLVAVSDGKDWAEIYTKEIHDSSIPS